MVPEPDETDLGPFSGDGAQLTPWSVTVDALRRIQKYMVATVRSDGRPHVTPVLATPALTGVCFASGPGEQKSKNIDANDRCVLTAGSEGLTGFDYVIEGTARIVGDQDQIEEATETFETNLGWNLTSEQGNWSFMAQGLRNREIRLYLVQPHLAFAYWNGAAFGQTRYRWDQDE